MKKNIIIFGVGSMAKIAYLNLINNRMYDIKYFTAHEHFIREKQLFDLKVIPFEELPSCVTPENFYFLITIGICENE